MIDPVTHETKSFRRVVACPRFIEGKYRRRLVMSRAGGDDAIDRDQIIRMSEVSRDAQEIGEIELADPERIDSGHRGDRLDVGEPLVGLDLGDEHGASVQRGHLAGDVTALIVVVRESERGSPPTLRR